MITGRPPAARLLVSMDGVDIVVKVQLSQGPDTDACALREGIVKGEEKKGNWVVLDFAPRVKIGG